MSEYWKSTPHYWCKFCKTYVRDTAFERRNHEASGKHQGNIQRSLRELHKGAEATARDQQRAKDEVARLNGLVGGGSSKAQKKDGSGNILGLQNLKSGSGGSSSEQAGVSASAQRKAHAEQLAAMGVKLPAELQREVTGVGGWQTVSEKPVEQEESAGDGGWTLAEIKKSGERIKSEKDELKEGLKRGAAETADEGGDDQEGQKKRKVWGTTTKTYPGANASDNDDGDLDALLNGVKSHNKPTEPGAEALKQESEMETKVEGSSDPVKAETGGSGDGEQKLADVPPTVVFKKRKTKR